MKSLTTVGLALGPGLFLSLLIPIIATYGEFDMGEIFRPLIPVMIVATAGTIAATIYQDNTRLPSVGELRLELSLLREQRRLRAAEMTLDSRYARSSYKDEITGDVESFRRESRRYRRIHNGMQSVIIVGSLATTTVSGIALDSSPLQWVVVGSSFSVGLAAGFTGYFKYRERGFYLQQTADAIEQEYLASELSIFRYKNLTESESLAAFVEEAERLKSEQRKREQSLDQPSGHGRDALSTG
ncbi:DUF4231 domain-containing protein [Micromonospora sp. NPDC000663]|uniref:DUF4231 domain-containing protein n=1 Tax=Micromonospora sp. NPDC000663 TaxID=3364218 RepID=UPI003696FD62